MADGDDHEQRFELLYRQHFRTVLRYALARAEPERAKDAVSDTFLVAWRRLDDVPGNPAPWLLGVARKVLAGQYRAETRRDALAARLASAEARDTGPADPADQVTGRESALAALARLGEPDREALMLIAWDGLSAAESAAVIGVSKLTFTVRLHRARRRLAAELGTDPPPGAGVPGHARSRAVPAAPAQIHGRHADARSH